MKPSLLLHGVITLSLLIIILAFAVSMLMGIIEVRFPDKRQATQRPGGELPNPPAGGATTAKAKLVVVRGVKPAMEYQIYEGQNFLGRADEKPVDIDLEMHEPPERIFSSRQHAVITCQNGSLSIEDLNSTNGTFVNRSRVYPGKKQALKANGVIQIGEVQLKLLL